MDPASVATTIGAYLGLKELVPRILGPTADYLGSEMRSYTEKGAKNIHRIFENAGAKLGNDLNTPGQVSPKVLKGILDEGYFAEDELAAEYFGGVLASSRTTISRDDRGAAFVKLVSRLSVYQLRTHHLFYTTVRQRHLGEALNLHDQGVRKATLKTFLSYRELTSGLDIHGSESLLTLVPHILHGLVREELIEDTFSYGNPEHLKKYIPTVTEPGIILTPRPLGIELYLWAYGKGHLSIDSVFNPDISFKPLPEIVYPK